MNTDNYKQLIKKAPFGYAFHKIIVNENDKAIDYMFLDVNPAFENLTGLKTENIINQKITDVIPGIVTDKFDWISFYGEVALNGGNKEFEQFSEPLNRWYNVQVNSTEKYYFSTFFTDITDKKIIISQSNLFLGNEDKDIDYQQIVESMKTISGAKYLAFNIFEKNGLDFTTVAISGINEHIQKGIKILGFEIVGKKWKHDANKAEKTKDNIISRFKNLHELTGAVISKPIITLIEKTFKIGEIAVVKIFKGEKSLGDFTLIMAEGESLKNDISIELFAQQVGLFIDRNNIEEALKISEVKYRSLVNLMQVGIIIQDSQAKILFSNPKALEYLGISEDQLLGRTSFNPDWNVIHEDGSPFPGNTHPVPQAIATRLPVRNVIMGVYRPALKDRVWLLVDAEPQLNIDGTIHQVVCSFIDITERIIAEDVSRQLNEVQVFLAQHSGKKDELNFFELLAQYLAKTMEADFVCIDKLEGDGLNARTIAVWHDGQFEDNIVYSLKDTPCGDVVGKAICCFPASVCKLFPNDTVLQDLKAESYVGVTLWSHTGKPIGLIAVIKSNPIKNLKLAEDLLKMVAVRASGELERMETELVLKASEEKYRLLLENSGIGVGVYTLEGNIMLFNQKALDNLGGKAEDFTGKNLKEVFGEPTASAYLSRFEEVVNSETSLEYEDFVSLPTGNKWFLSNHSKIKNDEGEIIGIQVLAHDITERKLAVLEIEKNQKLLEDSQRIGKIGGWELNIDTMELKWTKEMYYIHEVELDFNLKVEKRLNFYTPESLPLIDKAVQNAIKHGKSYEIDSEIITAKGNRKYVKSIGKADIANRRIYGLFQDITERKQAENELKASETRFRNLLQDVETVSVQGYAPDGTTQYWNKASEKLYGYSAEEAIGKNLVDLIIPPDMRENISGAIIEMAKTGVPVPASELSLMRKDGSQVSVFSSHTIVQIPDKLQELFCIDIDLSELKKAEIAIQKRETQINQLLQTTDQGIYGIDLDGCCTFINKSGLNALGYQLEECLGKNMHDLIHHHKLDNSIYKVEDCPIFRAKDTGKGNKISNEIFWKKDGTAFFIEYSSFPIIENGEIQGSVITFSDITERKQIEEKLRESEERFREMSDLLPQIIFETDESGNLTYVNIQAYSILRYPANFNVKGINTISLYIPEDQIRAIENIKKRMKGENEGSNEYTMIRYDGSLMNVLVYSNPIIKNNKTVGLRGIIIDVSNIKQAELKLHETNAYLENLLNYANAPIIVWNQQFKIMRFNHAFEHLTGFVEKEVYGKSLEILFPAELVEKSMDLIRKTSTGERWESVEIEIQHIDKSIRTVLWNSATLFDNENKNPIATIAQGQDITERKLAEQGIKQHNEKLQLLNAEKDKFFSIIAHDLRSPFNGFLGLTQLMAEELPTMTIDQLQKIAVSMRNSASNLFNLLENLLEWSRIKQGLIPFVPVNLELSQLIKDSTEIMLENANKKEINLSIDIPDNCIVFADKNMLQTIVRNLVSNAVKFTARGGKINITAKSLSSDTVEVSINDTGIGMNKEFLENIFRIDTDTTRKGTEGESSTGLGLLLCKEFVEKHGGKIWAESEEGKGSTFKVSLPLKNNNLLLKEK
jgi:PAS domain S-box-containing protein